jgi:hypothetical protein
MTTGGGGPGGGGGGGGGPPDTVAERITPPGAPPIHSHNDKDEDDEFLPSYNALMLTVLRYHPTPTYLWWSFAVRFSASVRVLQPAVHSDENGAIDLSTCCANAALVHRGNSPTKQHLSHNTCYHNNSCIAHRRPVTGVHCVLDVGAYSLVTSALLHDQEKDGRKRSACGHQNCQDPHVCEEEHEGPAFIVVMDGRWLTGES